VLPDTPHLLIARQWHEAYRHGDVDRFLACLAPGWLMHEAGGTISTSSDLAEITRLHHAAFPDKQLTLELEVAADDLVAQRATYVFVHTQPYFDIEPTGRRVEFEEMVFHRFQDGRIVESWRLTHPASLYEALSDGSDAG
jgi:predicted ester cyclase